MNKTGNDQNVQIFRLISAFDVCKQGRDKIFLKSYFIFSSYCPLQIWALKICNQEIANIIIASSFKHGQLVDDE